VVPKTETAVFSGAHRVEVPNETKAQRLFGVMT
jgi:hypothetical protein